MQRGLALALALATALCCLPRAARAGGFTISIMGGRRSSSLVSLARPDDPSALFHNPAGLADQPGWQAVIANAFYFVRTDFRLRKLDPAFYPEINPSSCVKGSEPSCTWPVDGEGYYTRSMKPERYFGTVPFIGLTKDLGFLGKPEIVTGLAFYLPAFYGATLPADAPSAYHMVDGSFAVGSATFGAGWRLTPWLSLGASLSYNYMRIAIKRKMSVAAALTPVGDKQPTGIAIAGQSLIGDITMDYVGVDHGLGWGFGVLLSPLSWLNVGLNYMGATSPRFDGPVTLSSRDDAKMRAAFEGLKYKMPTGLEVEMPYPHSLQAGLSVAPSPRVELGVDVRLWLYQVYERQAVKPIYDPDEPGGEPMTEESLSSDKNYGLSYEVALGVLVRPVASMPGLELMAGVSYDQSPIPDETFSLDNPSLNSVNTAVGVRWRVTDHWRVTLSYLMYIYLERDITNSETSPPANGQGSGLAYLPAFEVQCIY